MKKYGVKLRKILFYFSRTHIMIALTKIKINGARPTKFLHFFHFPELFLLLTSCCPTQVCGRKHCMMLGLWPLERRIHSIDINNCSTLCVCNCSDRPQENDRFSNIPVIFSHMIQSLYWQVSDSPRAGFRLLTAVSQTGPHTGHIFRRTEVWNAGSGFIASRYMLEVSRKS